MDGACVCVGLEKLWNTYCTDREPIPSNEESEVDTNGMSVSDSED